MTDQSHGVLIVDDQSIFRRGLRAHLDVADDLVVRGEASNGEDAIAKARDLAPAVVLLDLHMPRRSGESAAHCGVEVIREIRTHAPGAKIIVLTMSEEPEQAREALDAGAHGYLLKDDEELNVAQSVRTAAAGQNVLDPRITRMLVARTAEPAGESYPFGLTRGEFVVLRRLVRGLTKQQVAQELSLTPKTVANRCSVIQQKLGAKSVAEAVETARRREGITREDA
ncbi:response regulator [Saccharothrix sp. Mg75]|uniref:response regulator n=1 Tax=Saccharothrix sp. Mg75 TaxID=3445357 RepID=UPI003EEA03C6